MDRLQNVHGRLWVYGVRAEITAISETKKGLPLYILYLKAKPLIHRFLHLVILGLKEIYFFWLMAN
jgi:hypothetical protein